MENRSHALVAGFFALVLIAACVAAAFWLGLGQDEHRKRYELVSAMSVSGLAPESAVRYQGVPVGKVESLSVNPDQPGQVRIQIAISDDTPVTDGTWAELAAQGVTGMAYVELHDDGSSRTPLRAEHAGDLPTIPLRPGLLDRVSARGAVIVDGVERLTRQLEQVLSKDNVSALHSTLTNLAALTGNLQQASTRVGPVMTNADALLKTIQKATDQAERMTSEVTLLAQDVRRVVERVGAKEGPLASADRSLQGVAEAASRLSNQTLPHVDSMADQIGQAAQNIGRAARTVGGSPQSLLFGAPTVAPGPGEAGFAGFGRTQ